LRFGEVVFDEFVQTWESFHGQIAVQAG
jgi:hypothetical protein